METLTNCPVCSGTKFSPFLSCKDYTVSRETFTIVRCEACGFRFTNPRPTEKEITKYYESEEYISHSGTNRGVVNKLYGMVRNYTIRKKVQLINQQIQNSKSQIRNILDIGCGTGEFLNACKENGWSVTGIEPSPIARENAKKNFGIDFYPDVFSPLFLRNNRAVSEGYARKSAGGEAFSLITMWHVLEHVHQLNKTIEQIKKILAENGSLIIAVPNCNSWDAKKYGEFWAAYDVPRHLYHFTKTDIEKLFSQFGFRLREVLPMKFDSYYVSLLSEKYKTGKSNLVAGFFNGLKSNLNAGARGHSSQIYVFNHNK